MPDTQLPTESIEAEHLLNNSTALAALSTSFRGTDMRTQELDVARAAVHAQLATASALVLVANAIREGWEDPTPEPDGDVVDLRPVPDGVPDSTSVTGWKPGHSPASLGDLH